MDWYKFAKIQKEALNMDDLYDFYLIASMSKDHLEYLFKADPEKRYYFAKKLDEIRHEYIIGGIFALNLELRHLNLHVAIKNPNEIAKKKNMFLKSEFWPSISYGGEKWALIAGLIYDLSQFPDLMDYIMQNPTDKALVETIYLLILKIDHLNDVCHNNGIALPKMLNEEYKPYVNINREDNSVEIKDESGYNNIKHETYNKVSSFLDFKKEYDIRNILLKRNGIDKDILESLESPSNNQVGVDVESIPYILNLVKKYGYENLNVDKKELYMALTETIMVGGFRGVATKSMEIMDVEEQADFFAFFIDRIKRTNWDEGTLISILDRLIFLNSEVYSLNKKEIIAQTIREYLVVVVDKINKLTNLNKLLSYLYYIKADERGKIKENIFRKIQNLISNSDLQSINSLLKGIKRMSENLNGDDRRLATEVINILSDNISKILQSETSKGYFSLYSLYERMVLITDNMDVDDKKTERIFSEIIKNMSMLVTNFDFNDSLSNYDPNFAFEQNTKDVLRFFNEIIGYNEKYKQLVEYELSMIKNKIVNYYKNRMEDSGKTAEYWLQHFNDIQNSQIFTKLEYIDSQMKHTILTKIKRFLEEFIER